MLRTSTLAIVALAALGASAPAAEAQSAGHGFGQVAVPVAQTANIQFGRLEGRVFDDRGRPLSGVAVSAQGAALNFAVTDDTGRYAFTSLQPGAYWLRARMSGFASSGREVVVVRPADATMHSIRLRRTQTDDGAPAVLAAGVGGAPAAADSAPDDDSPGALDVGDDHTALAWHLRHAKRSVLRDETGRLPGAEDGADDSAPPFTTATAFLTRAIDASAHLATSLFSAAPLSGQVRLATVGTFESPAEFFTPTVPSRSVAYFALESPDGDWSVQGATTQGDLSSWVVAGAYEFAPAHAHLVDVAVSYAAQTYGGGNPAAVVALADGSRKVGSVQAFDRYDISSRASLTYGTRYQHYDYLERGNLFSPSVGFSFAPARATWIRASVSQQMLAPGAEEFLPTLTIGVWGPPERTFSWLASDGEFRPERTRHFEVAVEREFGELVVSVRRFDQQVDDQLVTLFGFTPEGGSNLGHYVVGDVGQAAIDGWGFGLARPVGSRLRGSIEYVTALANFSEAPSAAQAGEVSRMVPRGRVEQVHDLTGLIEAQIPETATRVWAVYKWSNAFARSTEDPLDAFNYRFDVQVNQSLPIRAIGRSEWELLVAVRNLFHERLAGASLFDELLVVRPPKRVLGGVSVRF